MRKTYLYSAFGLGVLLLTMNPFMAVRIQAAPLPEPQALVISEVQTTGLKDDGAEDGTKEFVELYNPSATPLEAGVGWRLEYLSASNDGSGTATRTLGAIDVVIGPKSYLLFSYEGYLADADRYFGAGNTSASGWIAKSGGHIRVVTTTGQTIDAVSWGSAVTLKSNPAVAWWRASAIPAGVSIQRLLPGSGGYVTGLEFAAPGGPTPYGGNVPLPPESEETPPATELPPCEHIVLSELLPNPAGADNGHEFIEVHNPTETAVNLQGCSLRLGATGDGYMLPNTIMEPHSYQVFYDAETGITLPNATAQTIWLITATDEQGLIYPDDLDDDRAWALIEGTWQVTMQPTPGEANVKSSVSPDAVSTIQTPATAKSKTLAVQTPCPTDKERNPATNRCRSIATAAAAAPKPCKAGQERNPETGRCRSVLSAAQQSRLCPKGQERNPETNRCRKKAGMEAANLAQIQDVNTLSSTSNIRWWIAGLAVAGVGGYALYEWRRDLGDMLRRLRLKYTAKK